jgi:heptaprenylglyceryl phosphate synthase
MNDIDRHIMRKFDEIQFLSNQNSNESNFINLHQIELN